MDQVAEDKKFTIWAPNCGFISNGFYMGNTDYNLKVGGTTVNVTQFGYGEYDVSIGYSFKQEGNTLKENKDSLYKYLDFKSLLADKLTTEELLCDKFAQGYIRQIPAIYFKFNAYEKSLQEHALELKDKWKEMKEPEHVLTDKNEEPIYVLRPTNSTHAILAFRVNDISLFRGSLFEVIVSDLKMLWENKKKHLDVWRLDLVIRANLQKCGLSLISESTMGMEGVYSDKTDIGDVYKWSLSLFIKGKDARAVKAGKRIFLHEGYHEDKGKPIQSDPVEVNFKKMHDFMDNEITPLVGSCDFRNPPGTDTLYFMETSFSFSSECYSTQFCKERAIDAIEVVLEKHKEIVGDVNVGWEERRDEMLAKNKEERQKQFEEDDIRLGAMEKTDVNLLSVPE